MARGLFDQRRTSFGHAAASLACAVLVCACAVSTAPEPSARVHRPAISEYMAEPAILVYSGTAGWRHDEGIAGADLYFAELAAEKQYGLFTTEHAGVFNPEDLQRFDVIVFNNVSGDVLNTAQRQAFENWMTNGGAWIGLHGSGDHSMGDWEWYQTNLIGVRFIGHTMAPQFQDARLVVLDDAHPVTANLPADWTHHDEWYSFDGVPDMPGVTVLVGLDEASYQPTNTVVAEWPTDLRMGEAPGDHPIVWARCEQAYRAVYSGIGHSHESYKDPVYRQMLSNAFDWVTQDGGSAERPCA